MSSTAVCGDCNAVVGFDAASCGKCGRVFPKDAPKVATRRKEVDREFVATHYGMMLIIAAVVTGFSILLWRDPATVVDERFVATVIAGAFLPLLVARLALIHTPRAAWVAFALTLAAVSGYRIVAVSHAIDVQRRSAAAVAEFDDAMRQLRERHRLFLMREETGEALAAGHVAQVRAATSADDMYALLAGALRANSDRAMQLHVAWQRDMDKINEVMRPGRLVTAKGVDQLRAAVVTIRAANARLANDEQAMRLELLAQVNTIVGDRPERAEVLRRIQDDMARRGSQVARVAAFQEQVAVLVDEVFVFMGKRLGHVKYENNMLLFDDVAHMRTFGRFRERLIKLENADIDMRTQMVASMGRYR